LRSTLRISCAVCTHARTFYALFKVSFRFAPSIVCCARFARGTAFHYIHARAARLHLVYSFVTPLPVIVFVSRSTLIDFSFVLHVRLLTAHVCAFNFWRSCVAFFCAFSRSFRISFVCVSPPRGFSLRCDATVLFVLYAAAFRVLRSVVFFSFVAVTVALLQISPARLRFVCVSFVGTFRCVSFCCTRFSSLCRCAFTVRLPLPLPRFTRLRFAAISGFFFLNLSVLPPRFTGFTRCMRACTTSQQVLRFTRAPHTRFQFRTVFSAYPFRGFTLSVRSVWFCVCRAHAFILVLPTWSLRSQFVDRLIRSLNIGPRIWIV